MSLGPPKNPSLSDRAYLFLQDGLGCIAALFCLFGGFICAGGVSRSDWRLIILGGLMMLPYAVPALIFLLAFIPDATSMMFFTWREWHVKPLLKSLKKRFPK